MSTTGPASGKTLAAPQAGERKAAPLSSRRREELEFLPAALEVMDTPPSPTARVTAVTLIVLVGAAIAWSYFGRVDEVAVAEGKILPSGHTKVIQPLEIGVVKSIRVHDGQSVHQGDILIELDPTTSAADKEKARRELMQTRVTIARLIAYTGDGPNALASFNPPKDADELVVETQRRMLLAAGQGRAAKLSAIAEDIRRQEAQRRGAEATIAKIEKTIPLIQERVDAKAELLKNGNASRTDWLTLRQQLIEQQQDLQVQQQRVKEISAAIAGQEQQLRQSEAEMRRDALNELTEAEQKAAGLAQELIKADQRHSQQNLLAPIDGIVQQLAVHTVGGVVTPAETLMALVPDEQVLEVEANILNRDIGFIRPGQLAEIKLDAFPFTRYGTIPGHVVSVSADAIDLQKPGGDPKQPDARQPDPSRGLVYAARIALDRTRISIDGTEVALGPGMATTVEIKTGDRRVIEYLLSPVMRYRQESFRER
jgi:hemolysin D